MTNTTVYEDSKVKIDFLRVEKYKYGDDRVNVYFDAKNKTNETILIQNDTVVINGRSYDHTVMSDPVLPYTTGNVNVSVKDTNISGNVNTVGGQFRIISDAKSFKSYDAVLGKTSSTSSRYDEDDYDYDDEDEDNYYETNAKVNVTDRSAAYSKLKSQLILKGDKVSSGGYMITNLKTLNKDGISVSVNYNTNKNYICCMIMDLDDNSETNVTTLLYLYENKAPQAMLTTTGKLKSTFMGEYYNSEISVLSSTHPSINASAIKMLNSSYELFDKLMEINNINMTISDFEIDY